MANVEPTEHEQPVKLYEEAWSKAKKAGDEICEMLSIAARATSTSTREVLEREAHRAIETSERWRRAAEGLLERLKKRKT